MTARRILLLIGLGCFVAAAAGGLVPLSAEGSSCGTAFVPSDEAAVDDWTTALTEGRGGAAEAACASLRSVVAVPIAMLAAVGCVPLVAAWSLSRPPESRSTSTQHPPSD
ncbi:hypothetical protein [Salinactinospora qingdaonensis]|uniref:Uncharacterized protein n=1 Tax=Salinactinospora qingdaonensis TaxID=702744 RepID=A0ABP7G686_9ACTN